mmetsp:Transcript_29611/g.69449  ORF Transcript_29611/g.69449 Transcript_29611/m.69449 type:complete len:227 (-) Transcript_29611:197-877(-)
MVSTTNWSGQSLESTSVGQTFALRPWVPAWLAVSLHVFCSSSPHTTHLPLGSLGAPGGLGSLGALSSSSRSGMVSASWCRPAPRRTLVSRRPPPAAAEPLPLPPAPAVPPPSSRNTESPPTGLGGPQHLAHWSPVWRPRPLLLPTLVIRAASTTAVPLADRARRADRATRPAALLFFIGAGLRSDAIFIIWLVGVLVWSYCWCCSGVGGCLCFPKQRQRNSSDNSN